MSVRQALVSLGALAGLVVPSQAGTPLLTRCHYRAQADTVRVLPAMLHEISGLAFFRGQLLAHNDELGGIYTINPATGSIGNFATLRGPIQDDFEGIAVLGDTVWLMTSSGKLYGVKASASTTPVAFSLQQTGLGKRCELEGLAADASSGVLLLPCKTLPKNAKGVVVSRWNPRANAPGSPATVTAAPKAIKQAGAPHFRPSAIEMVPGSDHLLLLSSSPPALMELDGSGAPVGWQQLSPRHAQPEGLAISPRGDLFISDEGGAGAATLSVYRCHP